MTQNSPCSCTWPSRMFIIPSRHQTSMWTNSRLFIKRCAECMLEWSLYWTKLLATSRKCLKRKGEFRISFLEGFILWFSCEFKRPLSWIRAISRYWERLLLHEVNPPKELFEFVCAGLTAAVITLLIWRINTSVCDLHCSRPGYGRTL